jgi:hypothetical protein
MIFAFKGAKCFFDPENPGSKKHEFRQWFEPEQEFQRDRRNKSVRW